MANPQWPAELPLEVPRQGYREELPATAIATTMDSGRRKRRRRFTAAPEPIDVPVEFTSAEVDTFKAFFADDLAGGALPFDRTHPRTGAAETFAFRTPEQPPAFEPTQYAKLWRAVLELEIEP